MAGLLGGFTERMRQQCVWTKREGDDKEWGEPQWGESLEVPCIFFASRYTEDAVTGAVLITPATLYLQAVHEVSEGDKVEFRGRTYIVESIESIEWFGGVHDGYKCLCRQEGGVAV